MSENVTAVVDDSGRPLDDPVGPAQGSRDDAVQGDAKAADVEQGEAAKNGALSKHELLVAEGDAAGDYLERLLDFATRTRWGKRPILRGEALSA